MCACVCACAYAAFMCQCTHKHTTCTFIYTQILTSSSTAVTYHDRNTLQCATSGTTSSLLTSARTQQNNQSVSTQHILHIDMHTNTYQTIYSVYAYKIIYCMEYYGHNILLTVTTRIVPSALVSPPVLRPFFCKPALFCL